MGGLTGKVRTAVTKCFLWHAASRNAVASYNEYMEWSYVSGWIVKLVDLTLWVLAYSVSTLPDSHQLRVLCSPPQSELQDSPILKQTSACKLEKMTVFSSTITPTHKLEEA